MGTRFRGDRPGQRHRAAGAAHARRDRGRYPGRAARHRGAAVRTALDADDAAAGCSTPPACPARRIRSRALIKLMACPDLALEALDLGAVRSSDHGQYRRTARGGDAAVVRVPKAPTGPATRAWRSPPTARRATAGRSRDRRQAGGRRDLAQPDRGRRAAARRHRQHEFRQPAEARDHGRVRRRHRRHARGLHSRSTTRSSRAMSRSTTRPRAGRSCRPR